MDTIFGKFDRKRKEIELNNNRYSYYEESDYICSIYGDIWINESYNDYPNIVKLYKECGDDIVNQIEGLFYLIIYEKRSKVLKIYQDYYTSSETLYYTVLKELIFFSNDIKQLISLPGITREFNDAMSAGFVKYGYVPGRETLIKGIYKIEPFHMLLCQDQQVLQRRLEYHFPILSEDESKRRWVEDLNRAIRLNTPDEETVTFPLSGGFDSNYMMHYYSEQEVESNIFSVGGTDGIDETEVVRKIVKSYGLEKNRLTICYVSDDMLSNLPDIIWRLGGLMYQRGIFLQYKLAYELYHAGVKNLVCGECADQVMNEKFLGSGIQNENPDYKGQSNPYDFAAHIILKKSGIMLNSFGVKGYYPYMNQQFVTTAIGVGRLNGTDKWFHRKICNDILPDDVKKCLHKSGGATHIHALFASDEEKKRFIRIVENSTLFKENLPSRPPKKTVGERIQFIISKYKKYSKGLIRRLRAVLRVRGIRALSPEYRRIELRLRRDMSYFYLMIFKELFCSEQTERYLKEGVKSFDVHEYIKMLSME